MIKGEPIYINGDGNTSRDFCYIDNVVQANLLAASTQNSEAVNHVYNIAVGDRTSLTELYELMKQSLRTYCPHLKDTQAVFREFRAADVRHSLASIKKARERLAYDPTHSISQGLKLTCFALSHKLTFNN
jgi:UDP-N-acetylglucosamine 4-epimerase